MNKTLYLANRLREVLLNGTFIANTNFKAQIEQTTFKEATHQIADLNTIALLTFHINYYLQGVNDVFEGKDLLIKDKFSFDMPLLQNEDNWTHLKQMLLKQAERFINHVEQFTDDDLNQPFVNQKYGTLQRNIESMIEHYYYHLGQIVLIRKLIAI